MTTQYDMERLIVTLGLSPYQARQIYKNRQQYDIGRLEMRGDVLFAPISKPLWVRLISGRSGDVIGRDKVFLCGARRVKLISGGYYRGRTGRTMQYGGPDGCAVDPSVFESMKRHK